MKNLKMIIATLALVVGTMTATARPMSYDAMRNNARFLTDRMAYTLGLSTALLDDLYYINYDYICGVNDYLDDVALGYYYDDYMAIVRERDYALQRLLTSAQWAALMSYDYFYRPISFVNRAWRFAIYAFDTRPNYYYYRVPRLYTTYRGGHHFHGMRPAHRHNAPAHRPSYRIERHGNSHINRPGNGGSRPGNDRVERPNSNNRPNGSNANRPEGSAGRPESSVSGGRTESNRSNRVSDTNRSSSRSESNMRSSSRAGSRSSNVNSRPSSSNRSSSISRSGGSGRSSSRGSSSSATRGGGSERCGRR